MLCARPQALAGLGPQNRVPQRRGFESRLRLQERVRLERPGMPNSSNADRRMAACLAGVGILTTAGAASAPKITQTAIAGAKPSG
jgi:hypothetical protein